MRKTALIITLVLGLAAYTEVPAAAQPATGLQAEADAAARKLWDSILTKCGDSYFYLSRSTNFGMDELYEFRDVSFGVTEIRRPSRAQELNHVEGSVLTMMNAQLYRERANFPKDDWDRWYDGPGAMWVREKLARLSWDNAADYFGFSPVRRGTAAFHMTKYHGEWYIDLRSTFFYESATEENSLSHFAGPKLTCEAIQHSGIKETKKGR